jgi:chromo domain-containing protein 1
MRDIVEKCQHGFGTDEPGEDIRKTVWIDDIISPDDEQSLLNWFAAWSTTKLDTYRKFYALGSSSSDIKKARRKVRVPNYTLETVNNPEAAFSRLAAGQNTSGDLPPVSKSLSAGSAAMVTGKQTLPPPAPYVFQSEILRSDRATDIRAWLLHLISVLGKSWARLYDNPVSWLDLKMADHFKDPRSEYATYMNWFSFPPKFAQRVNTLIGLFYTVGTDWNEHDEALSAGRHPWIAVFRPVDPHLNQDNYTKMELLIWDCAVGKRWPIHPDRDQSIRSGELIPMQRRLIDFVQEQAPKRFEEYFLERVFIGGWNPPERLHAPSAIDVTCGVIRECMTNGRDILPPWDGLLLNRGWRKVNFGPQNPTAPPTEWIGTDPSLPVPASAVKKGEIPKCASDLEEPERIIFHPPRSNLPLHSVCTNDLYSAALQARKTDPDCMTFEYRYRPTMEWYHELKKENRDYNHMNVDTWDMIFDDLRLIK